MIQPALDRRTFLTFGLAGGLSALAGFDARAAPHTHDEPIRLKFGKGDPVPLWLEVSTKPEIFGTEVEVIEERIPEVEREAFARMGYRDDAQVRLTVSATGHMKIGDCLIRYPERCRTLFAAKQPYKGRVWPTRFVQPPGTWMWTEDGPAMLLFARVAEPEFRIVNERLAERVLPPVA